MVRASLGINSVFTVYPDLLVFLKSVFQCPFFSVDKRRERESVNMCVHMCVHACVCTCMCMCACACGRSTCVGVVVYVK